MKVMFCVISTILLISTRLPTAAFVAKQKRALVPKVSQRSKAPWALCQSSAFVRDTVSLQHVSDRRRTEVGFLEPPPPLDSLAVGEEWIPFGPLRILKVSNDPPIFILRNFLPQSECEQLINDAIQQGLNDAQTRTSAQQHRVGSTVAWLRAEDSPLADFMTQLSAHLFYHEEAIADGLVCPENVQVVKYDTQGRFDLHHDGLDRTFTVLTYLNGVAGTWFPFVYAGPEDMPSTSFQNRDAVLKGKQPGKDGLLIIGSEGQRDGENSHTTNFSEGDSTVHIMAGDAVVFYNYEKHEEHGKVINWKAIHCGLPAVKPKWIATNWFSMEMDDDNSN